MHAFQGKADGGDEESRDLMAEVRSRDDLKELL
jgi:hypothetical protein